MRYEKLYPKGSFKLPSWMPLPGAVRFTLQGLWNAVQRPPLDPNTNPIRHMSPTLWLPWWMWLLAGVAIVAAGWYRRRSTLVLLVLALVIGVMFIEWPEHAIWNTRFLPFWMLSWAFVAAMGATEIARLAALLVSSAYMWIRDGDLQDARARAWAEIATADDDSGIDPEARKDAAWALADRRFDRGPEGWEPPARLSPRVVDARRRRLGTLVLAFVVAMGGVFALERGFRATGHNSAIAIRGWAAWNYSGYEEKADYPQYHAIMTGMEQVADTNGPGRALWEPSSGSPDAINSYGTSLALELLPYFTNGKIASMEGIYFEASATTDYHFLTVAECSQHPSNPVRGLVYGNPDTDFDLCVRHLQMLGVRYYMAWTPEMQKLASKNANLTLVKDIPQNPSIPGPSPDTQLKDWKVYQVADSDLVVGMDHEPVVLTSLPAGEPKYSSCWDQAWAATSGPEPRMLDGWECTSAPWWVNRSELGTAYAQTGPSSWQRVKAADLAHAQPRTVVPAQVSNVKTSVDQISFDVSEIGKPVEVKESYFPNWHVTGASGPYRLAPNLMVVVPTSTHVQLRYGLTTADWAGRVITGGAAVGLVVLALWTGATKFAAGGDQTRDRRRQCGRRWWHRRRPGRRPRPRRRRGPLGRRRPGSTCGRPATGSRRGAARPENPGPGATMTRP